jgi:formylglycine-generating enzyme required for sulfatase activity
VHDIATYWLDETEVTQAAYRECVAAGACTPPQTVLDFNLDRCNWDQEGREGMPVNCVDWAQADAYCAWVGKRLPDEWEWEWAARGREEGWPYPWGGPTTWTPRLASCAYAVVLEGGGQGPGCGAGTTATVGSNPAGASRDGVLDLIGNVREWTSSWRDASQEYRITRGGGFRSATIVELRVDNRYAVPPDVASDNIGVRCAQSPPP